MSRIKWIGHLCLVCCLLSKTQSTSLLYAEDYYPDHPVVVDMIDRAIKYLENPTSGRAATGMFDPGSSILAAYAVFKIRDDLEHPLVVRGESKAVAFLRGADSDAVRRTNEKYIYDIAVASILLATLDVDKHRALCTQARDLLIRYSRSFGGWGYLNSLVDPISKIDHAKTIDISQTQYAILALWTLDQMGVPVDPDPIERAVKMLMDVQDPNGAWGYQGMNSQAGREPQSPLTHSLAAAGLGSLLIAGDLLGFYRNRMAESQEPDIPKAFRLVVADAANARSTTMDRSDTDESVNLGVRWHDTNVYQRPPGLDWHYYYRYSEERFRSFHEIARRRPEKSPAWYNQAVEEFRKNQHASGGWGVDMQSDADHCPPELATAFAILYLNRTTQKAIGALNEGIVRGGVGLPADISDITVMDGQIVDNAKVSSFDEILKLLESEDPSQTQEVVVTDKLKLEKDPKRRKDQLNRLARLIRSKDPLARRAAAKLLGRGDDLDFVPTLIYALTDEDRDVCRNAESSLRILSRQLNSKFLVDLEGEARHYTKAERLIAVEKWKDWYKSIRPDFVFADG